MKQTSSIGLIIISYLLLVITNIFAIQLPFFGKTPGDVSDLYPNLLTPADFTFSIWSVIYLGLGIAIYALYKKYSTESIEEKRGELEAIKFLFPLTCILNIAWLISWQSLNIVPAFFIIFVYWTLLIVIRYRLCHFENIRWVIKIPFSLYLGWISIATLANLNVMLYELDFNFFNMSQDLWTATLIAIGIIGTLFVLMLYQDIPFSLVLIWAFFGIYMKNSNANVAADLTIYMTNIAMVVIALTSLVMAFQLMTKRKHNLAGLD